MFVCFLLVIVDAGYLLVVSAAFQRQILRVQHSPMSIRWSGAVVCYALLSLLLVKFLFGDRTKRELCPAQSFLLGLCVYGIYDSTNYATLRNWDATIAAADTLWGGCLFAAVTWIYKNQPWI
jgi:uncharacterized membrane protein